MLNTERTVAIVCGASEWPRLPQFESAPAFANSAAALRDYLTGPTGLTLHTDNVLWLFEDANAVAQYERIEAFLGQRLAALGTETGTDVLILFVYIGHGAFFGGGREYCLLVRDTRAPIEADTSLRVTSLSRLLRLRAPESSRVLILDCCFAGEAAHAFQGGLEQAVAVKAEEVIATTGDRGVALLCAASARNPARLQSLTTSTLFSLELMRALGTGDPTVQGPLTLRQLCALVRRGLLEHHADDEPPMPEVHVPNQAGGDLAALPLFPNAAAPLAHDDLGDLRVAVSDQAGWRREAALHLVERGLASMHEHVRREALDALRALVADDDPDVAASARTLWRSRGLGDLPADSAPPADGITASQVVGIDFGTTNSAVGVFHRGEVRMVPNPEGSLVTPSVVTFMPDETVEIGERARRASARFPSQTVRSVKLKLGSDWAIEAHGRRHSPEDVAALILRRLVDDARTYIGGQVAGAVLTVPAQFDILQRQALVAAGEQAGLHVWRVVTEPTAAATTFGLNNPDTEATVIVFDLGGGTLDVSLLEIGEGVCEVKAAMGDNQLGGDDWDRVLVQHLLAHVRARTGVDLSTDSAALERLSEAAHEAKLELSAMREAEVHLMHICSTDSGSHDLDLVISRTQFEGITRHLLERCRAPLEQVVREAGITFTDVDQVILIGGATRMPAVGAMVRDITGREPLRSIIPEGVVLGATLNAGILNGDVKDVLLLDVTAQPLGIETADNVMTTVIERNTTIPTKRSEVFDVPADHARLIQVHVLEGDVDEASRARSLGLVELSGLRAAENGGFRVEVCFDIDANGVVLVEARDLNSDVRQSLTVGRESARVAQQRRAGLRHLPQAWQPSPPAPEAKE